MSKRIVMFSKTDIKCLVAILLCSGYAKIEKEARKMAVEMETQPKEIKL